MNDGKVEPTLCDSELGHIADFILVAGERRLIGCAEAVDLLIDFEHIRSCVGKCRSQSGRYRQY